MSECLNRKNNNPWLDLYLTGNSVWYCSGCDIMLTADGCTSQLGTLYQHYTKGDPSVLAGVTVLFCN